MATITTNFGTATSVTPVSIDMNVTEAEAAALIAEAITAFTPVVNRTNFPNMFALMNALRSASNLVATPGANGTAPPQATTVVL